MLLSQRIIYSWIIIVFLLVNFNSYGTDFTWNGSVSSSWNNYSNWTVTAGGTGISSTLLFPGADSARTDNVTIGTGGTINPVLHADYLKIGNLTFSVKELNLGGFTLEVKGNATLNSGKITNGSLKINSTSGTATFAGTTMDVVVNSDSKFLLISNTTFNYSSDFNSRNDALREWTGGNTFNGPFSLKLAGTHPLNISKTTGNEFRNTATLINTSPSSITATIANLFNGDIFAENRNLSTILLLATRFNGNINITATGGFVKLTGTIISGKTIITDSSKFANAQLYLSGFIQEGSDTITLDLIGSNTTGTGNFFIDGNSLIKGPLRIKASHFTINPSRFEGTCYFERTGSTTIKNLPGAEFFNTVEFVNAPSCSNNWIMCGETYHKKVTIDSRSNKAVMNFGYESTCIYEDSVVVKNNVSGSISGYPSIGVFFGGGSTANIIFKETARFLISPEIFTQGLLSLNRIKLEGTKPQFLTASNVAIISIGTGFISSCSLKVKAGNIFLADAEFNDVAEFEKYGAGTDEGVGGNKFYKKCIIKNSGAGNFAFGKTKADEFKDTVEVYNTGTGGIFLAEMAKGNIFSGDVYLHCTSGIGIGIGYYVQTNLNYRNSTSLLASGKSLIVSPETFSAGNLLLYGLTVDSIPKPQPNSIQLQLGANATITFGTSSVFWPKVYTKSGNIAFNGATFNSEVFAEKLGAGTSSGAGGCTFNKYTELKNSSEGGLVLGISNGDNFKEDVNLINTGTSIIHLGRSSATTYFNGYVIVNNTGGGGVQFGNYYGGYCEIADGKTIKIGDLGFTGGAIYMKMKQVGTTPLILNLPTSEVYFGSPTHGERTVIEAPVKVTSPRITFNIVDFKNTLEINRLPSQSTESCNNINFYKDVVFNLTGIGNMTFNYTVNFYGNVTINKTETSMTGTGVHFGYGPGVTSFYKDIFITTNTGTPSFGFVGSVSFKGTSSQWIKSNVTIPIARVTIEKESGNIYLGNNMGFSCCGSPTFLSLKKGNIVTGNYYVNVRDNDVITDGNPNSFIDGKIRKTGDELFTFPIGKNGLYRPFTMSAPGVTTASYEIEYFNESPGTSASLPGGVNSASACEYWVFDRKVGTANVSITPTWTNTCTPITSDSRFVYKNTSTNQWEIVTGTLTGNTASGSFQTGTLTKYGIFTFTTDFIAALKLSFSTEPNSCKGANDGKLSFQASDGKSPYTYLLNGSATTVQNYTNLGSGTYTISVTDARGESVVEKATVFEGTELVVEPLVTDESCVGANNGSVKLKVSNMECGSSTQPVSSNGCYSAPLPKAEACLSGCSQILSGSSDINLQGAKQVCIPESYTGKITLVNGHNTINVCGLYKTSDIVLKQGDKLIVYGTLEITNIKSEGTDSEIINYGTIKLAGDFNIQGIVKNYGKIEGAAGNMNVDSPGKLYNYKDITLAGTLQNNRGAIDNQGSISVDKSLICNPGTSFHNNCTVIAKQQFIIHAGAIFRNNGIVKDVTETFLNGTGFSVTSGSTFATGTLRLTGTIKNEGTQCSKISSSYTVLDNPTLDGFITLCDLDNKIEVNNGITLQNKAVLGCDCTPASNTGGTTASGLFSWSDGTVSDYRENLVPGIYSVTAKCGACTAPKSIEVKAADSVSVAVTGKNESCRGLLDGKLSAKVNDSVNSYQYFWTLPDGSQKTGAEITGLEAGVYKLKAVSSKGCVSEKNGISLGYDKTDCTSPCLNLNASVADKDIFCTAETGSATLVTGNTTQHIVKSSVWMDNNNTEIARGLFAGELRQGNYKNKTYFNYLGTTCYKVFDFAIERKGNYQIIPGITPACKDDKGGSVLLNLPEEYSPYEIEWSHSADENTESVTGLSSGNYRVKITDQNSCVKELYVNVPKGTSDCSACDGVDLQIRKENVLCTGQNGWISLKYNINANPVSFQWYKNGQTYASIPDISDLSVGTYDLKADFIIDGQTCSLNPRVKIYKTPELRIAGYSVQHPSGPGCADGQAALYILGGKPAYKYEWNKSSVNLPVITRVSSGILEAVITDDNGCKVNFSKSLVPTGTQCDFCSEIAFNINTQDVLCPDMKTGQAEIKVLDSCKINSVSWKGGNYTSDELIATNLGAGIYSAKMDITTNEGRCIIGDYVKINQPDSLVPFVKSGRPTCPESKNGWINLTGIGGTSPVKVVWANGTTGTYAPGLSAGHYQYTITDSRQCVYTSSVTLSQQKPSCNDCEKYEMDYFSKDPKCNKGKDGMIQLNPSQYDVIGNLKWTYPDGRNSFDRSIYNLTAGEYILNFTLYGGYENCNKTVKIILKDPAPINIQTTSLNNPSPGNTNGSVIIKPEGGTGNTTSYWPVFQYYGNSLTELSAGKYNVIVTDENQCQNSKVISLTESVPSDPCQNVSLALSPVQISCAGKTDGQLILKCPGFQKINSITWTGSNTNQPDKYHLTGLGAGLYSVEVEGEYSGKTCRKNISEIVGIRESSTIELDVKKSECLDSPNGVIHAQVSNTVSPESFLWETRNGDRWELLNQNTESIYNLPAATYKVSVNVNGCTHTAETVVEQSSVEFCDVCDAMTFELDKHENECSDDNKASIDLKINNKFTDVYTLWKKDGNWYSENEDISDLKPGYYELELTYSVGDALCKRKRRTEIVNPLPLTIGRNLQEPCEDGSGYIVAQVSGGTPGYSYLWNEGGIHSSYRTISTTGNYTVSVADANGCKLDQTFTVSKYRTENCTPLSFDISVHPVQTTCSPNVDISLAFAEGKTYTQKQITWTLPDKSTVSNQESLLNQVPGTYTVTVTAQYEGVSYSDTKTFVVEKPEELKLFTGIKYQSDPSAPPVISVQVTGGVKPYTLYTGIREVGYEFIPVRAELPAVDLTVSDANCSRDSETIEYNYNPDEYEACSFNVKPKSITCLGGSDGGLTAELMKPDAFAIFKDIVWGDLSGKTFGQDMTTVSDLSAGYYFVKATIARPDVICPEIILLQRVFPSRYYFSWVSRRKPESCSPGKDGQIYVAQFRMVPPLKYKWSHNTQLNNATATGLSSGYYSVTITDDKGCVSKASTTISKEKSDCTCQNLQIASDIKQVSCFGKSDGQVTLTIPQNVELKSIKWYKDNIQISPLDGKTAVTGLPPGNYSYSADLTISGAPCPKTLTFSITEPEDLILEVVSEKTSGKECNDGVITATVKGGTGLSTIKLNDSLKSDYKITGLTAANYKVVAEDANGCKEESHYDVPEGTGTCSPCGNLKPVFRGGKFVLCKPEDKGEIKVNLEDGSGNELSNVTYEWTYPDNVTKVNGNHIKDLSAGTYKLSMQTVYNGNSCEIKKELEVKQGGNLSINETVSNVSCSDAEVNDGVISLNVTGAVGQVFYYWDNSNDYIESPVIGGLENRAYTVKVQDGLNCTAEKTITVGRDGDSECNPSPLCPYAASYSVKYPTCGATGDGQITVNLTGTSDAAANVYMFAKSRVTAGKVFNNLTPGKYNIFVIQKENGAKKCVLHKTIDMASPVALINLDDTTRDESQYVTDVTSCSGSDGIIDFTGKVFAIAADGKTVINQNVNETDYTYSYKPGYEGYCQIQWYKPGQTASFASGEKLTGLTPGSYQANIMCGTTTKSTCAILDIPVGGGVYMYTSEDQTVCEGEDFSLSIESNAIDYDNCPTCSTYFLSSTGTRIERSSFTEKATANISYTAFASRPLGTSTCTVSKVIKVNVLKKPVLTYTASYDVCNKTEIPVTISSDVPATIAWTPGTGLSSTSGSSVKITGTKSELYKFTATASSSSCKTNGSINVTVKELPSAIVPESLTACNGSPVKLTAAGGNTYSWTPSDPLNNAAIADPVATLDRPQDFTVRVTAANECFVDKSVKVNVLDKFSPSVEIDYCNATGIKLTATDGKSFSWYPADKLDNINNKSVVITGLTEPSVYTAIITNDGNCSASVPVTVNPPTRPSAGSNFQICYGETGKLKGTGAVSYQWAPSEGLSSTTIAEPVVNINSNVEYTLTSKDRYGCTYTDKVLVSYDAGCKCEGGAAFVWTGNVDQDWDNAGNWQGMKVPGSSDNVLIKSDRIEEGAKVAIDLFPLLTKDVVINNLCLLGGELNLGGKTITVNGNGTFTGGTVKGSGLLSMKNNSPTQTAHLSGTTFNGNIHIENCPAIYLNGSIFNETSTFILKGTRAIDCKGGNTFGGKVYFVNEGTGDWYLSSIPGSAPDRYEGEISFEQKGTGTIYPSASNEDIYTGSIYFRNTGIVFGKKGGKVKVSGVTNQAFEAEDVSGYFPSSIYFNSLIVDKPVNSQLSKLHINVPATVGIGEKPGELYLRKGNAVTRKETMLVITATSLLKEYGSLSYVEGPLKKEKTNKFEFPVGKADQYNPFGLSANYENDYVVEFVKAGLPEIKTVEASGLKNVSTCEHFTVEGRFVEGFKATLGFDRRSCDVLNDLSKMSVAFAAGGNWKNLQNSFYTGSPGEGGKITAKLFPAATEWKSDINYFSLGSLLKPGNDQPTGFSFNNYGVNIYLGSNANLNVYGNVLNEKKHNGSDKKEDQGHFDNKGTILVEKDWTNNALNNVFAEEGAAEADLPKLGLVVFNGNAQRLRGKRATQFYKLNTDGAGIKTMYVNIFVNGILTLNDVEVSTLSNTLHINTSDANAIVRNEKEDLGFVSSGKDGFLKRNLATVNEYYFPVGIKGKYRPVRISPVNSVTEPEKFSVRMVDNDPENDGYPTSVRSTTISEINKSYYHIIRKEDAAVDFPVGIRLTYDPLNDGKFTSVAHWERETSDLFPLTSKGPLYPVDADGNKFETTDSESKISYWKNVQDYPGLNVSYFPKTADNSILYDQVGFSTWSDFDTDVFSLGRGGFVIQTNRFGQVNDDDIPVKFTMSGKEFGNDGNAENAAVGTPAFVTGSESGEKDGVNGGHTISPLSLAGEHIMNIEGNSTSTSARIQYVTDEQGRIKKLPDNNYSVHYLDEKGEKHLLSPALYDIYLDGRLISLKSSADASTDKCTGISFELNLEDPFVLKMQSGDKFKVKGLEAKDIQLLRIGSDYALSSPVYSATGSAALSSPFEGKDSSGNIVAEGAYFFELKLNPSGEILRGQFILTH